MQCTLMNFFTFRLRNPNQSQPQDQQLQIQKILESLNTPQNITFQQQWIQQLLTLFKSKEEIQLFWTIFSNSYLDMTVDSLNPLHQSLVEKIKKIQPKPTYIENQNEYQHRPLNPRLSGSRRIETRRNGSSEVFRNSRISRKPEKNIPERPRQLKWPYTLDQKKLEREKFHIPQHLIEAVREQYLEYLNCERERFNIQQISRKYNLHRATIYRRIRQWNKQPEFQDSIRIIQKHPTSKEKGTMPALISEWKKAIEEIVKENPFLTLQDIKKYLKSINSSSQVPTIKTIRRVLNSLGYKKRSLNSIKDRNMNQLCVIRQQYSTRYLDLINRPRNISICFVDSYKFYLNIKNQTAWLQDGQVPPQPEPQSFVTVHVVLSQMKKIFWQTTINKIDMTTKANILERLITKTKNDTQNPTNSLVFIYNCHDIHPGIMEEMNAKHQLNSLILSPSSEQLSPAYYFFRELKIKLDKRRQPGIKIHDLETIIDFECKDTFEWKCQFNTIKKYCQKAKINGRLDFQMNDNE